MDQKTFLNKNMKKIAFIAGFLVVIIGLAGVIHYINPQLFVSEIKPVIKKPVIKTMPDTQTPVIPVITPPIAEEIKNNPAKAPLKPTTKAVKPKTIATADGGKKISAGDNPLETPPSVPPRPVGSNVSGIKYIDETGQNASLEKELKDFLGSKLKVSTELPSLYSIKVLDAGASGWAGQYSYSYNLNSSGQITTETGLINLNVYYYKNDPRFVDYMKLVLSHEYGHHYTIYHKLMDWKLLASTRFPDSYYTVRNLSKTTTAVDYSLGWENCDAEIIAEDYSYIYSGFSYHGMSNTYGYPSSPEVAVWLGSELPNGPNATTVTDSPPVINITSPINNAEAVGQLTIQATATDDKKVSKVVFLINDTPILEDTTAPYGTVINTLTYDNGSYTLKATAYDDVGQVATSTISVNINNNQLDTIPPAVTIISPILDPLHWSLDDLIIEASTTDNSKVVRIEIYTNSDFRAGVNSDKIKVNWPFDYDDPGNYNLKIKAYDKAGNVGEKTILVIKS